MCFCFLSSWGFSCFVRLKNNKSQKLKDLLKKIFQPNMMEGQLIPLEMTQTSESDQIARMRDEELDSTTKSGSENLEGASGDDGQDPRPKKKRYHRHTQHQIQEMEAYVYLNSHFL